MSLARERAELRLICQCPRPEYRVLVLFSAWVFIDEFECAHCGKPIFEEYRHHLDEAAS